MAKRTDVSRDFDKKWNEAVDRIYELDPHAPRGHISVYTVAATDVIFTEIRESCGRIVEAIEKIGKSRFNTEDTENKVP